MIKLAQSPVKFFSETHKYFIGEKELQGITPIISRVYPNTYAGVSDEVLQNAARKGSLMHETIELFDEIGIESDLKELKSYKQVISDNNLKVIASEYIVSDEERYATAIDKVMEDSDGNVIIVDLKRTYKIHNENVRLQLSICKYLFEMQNKDLKVSRMYVLRLRDDENDFVEINPVSNKFLNEVLEKNGDVILPCEEKYPSELQYAEEKIFAIQRSIKELKEKQEILNKGLYDIMDKNGIKSWEGEKVKITRVLPQVKRSFDSSAFKREHADLYERYVKDAEISGSIRITIKKNED